MFDDLLRQLFGDIPQGTLIGAPKDEGPPDELRTLRLCYRDAAGQEVVTPALSVEVRHKAVFGFSPRRSRREVRLRLPANSSRLPAAGLSLREGEQVFGREQGWKVRWAEPGEAEGTIDFWLEEE